MKHFKVLLVYPNRTLLGVIPSSMALLAGCLKRNKFQVKLFDASLYRSEEITQDDLRAKLNQVRKTNIDKYVKYKEGNIYRDFVDLVNKYKPNLIAVTLVDDTIALGMSLLEKIKNYPILKIVGGVAVTFNYQKFLNNNLVDIVCIGEGEKALPQLCKKLHRHKDYSKIKNLYIKNKDGTIKKNPLRPLVDINKIPYSDFSVFDNSRFFRPFHGQVVRMAPIDTDRGCPYSCTYCAAPSLRKFYNDECGGVYFRTKNTDRIFSEIKKVVKEYKVNFIWFSSETFFAKTDKEIEIFAKRYIKEVNLPFWCQTRLDTFTDFRTKLLKEMGCQAVSVGLEHGNEEFRKKVLGKYISNDQILKSFKLLHKYNIPVTVNNIIGFPDETRKLIFDTINLNKKLNPFCPPGSTTNTFIFTPYSGTPLRKVCLDKGYITENSGDDLNYIKYSILKMPTISKEEIEGLLKTMVLYIKLPKSYYPKIKIAEKNTLKGNQMFDRLSQVLKEKYQR